MQLLVRLLQHWRQAVTVPGLASLLMVAAIHALVALKPAELTQNPVGGDKSTQAPCSALCSCIAGLSVHNRVLGTGLSLMCQAASSSSMSPWFVCECKSSLAALRLCTSKSKAVAMSKCQDGDVG